MPNILITWNLMLFVAPNHVWNLQKFFTYLNTSCYQILSLQIHPPLAFSCWLVNMKKWINTQAASCQKRQSTARPLITHNLFTKHGCTTILYQGGMWQLFISKRLRVASFVIKLKIPDFVKHVNWKIQCKKYPNERCSNSRKLLQ